MKNELQIYSASAGSGKTHILSQQFLKLAFLDAPKKYSRILAVTFTNKAAGEMKERIIKELYRIAYLKEETPHYKSIKEEYPDKDIQKEAQIILDKILHNYSQFYVSTIDSFVQRVIRSFAFEIGVQASYKIEMDNNKVLSDLTELLYQRLGKHEELLRWFIIYAQYKIDQGQNWDFRTEVKTLGQEIFKENFQQLESEQSSEKQDKKRLKELYKQIIKIKISHEKQLAEIADNVTQILKQNDVNIDDMPRNFKTICNYLTNHIVNGKTEPGATVSKALDNVEKWYAKKTEPNVKRIIEKMFPQLNDYLNNTIALYEQENSNYLTAKNTLANFHAFGILNDIAELLPEYREDNNLLLISDTTLLLNQIIANNDTPFIYEKTGTKFQHILIDEFQDTSKFQWSNFKPLIANSLANGFYNLIVGDIKQSIYRWRSGDWKLLLNGVEQDIGNERINNSALDVNWRSKKNIVDFNNSLFHYAPHFLQNAYNQALEDDVSTDDRNKVEAHRYNTILEEAYKDSYQKLPDNQDKRGGHIKLHFIKSSRRDMVRQWREEVYVQLPEFIDDLLKNKNYNPSDIAILVRKNKEGSEVVDLLLDYMHNEDEALHYDILSAESLFITNSNGVRLLISALKYLHNNNDAIHLTNLVREYQLFTKTDKHNTHKIFDVKMRENQLHNDLPQQFVNNMAALKKQSLYELVEQLIRIFELNCHEHEHAYLQTFQDTILNFSRSTSSDLAAFLDWWEEEKHRISIQISEKQNAVNVMTIHKSKGLAFKVVIVPFCDWPLDHSMNQPTIWCSASKAPFNSFKKLPIKYQAELSKTFYSFDYFEEKLHAYMDALNMLYVAFTRPVEELIVWSPFDEKMQKISYVSDLLYFSVLKAESLPNRELPVTGLNNFLSERKDLLEISTYYQFTDREKYRREKVEDAFEMTTYPNNEWQQKISIKHDVSDFFIDRDDYRRERINYGTMMHRILSQIELPSDVDNVLQDMYLNGMLTPFERMQLKQQLQEIISRETVKNWFSEKWIVKTEAEILSEKGETKIPDRILIGKTQVKVIDFKFGEQRDEHQEQLQKYVELLGSIDEIKGKPIEGFLYYADKNQIVKI